MNLRMANHIQDLLNKLNDGYQELTALQAEGAVGKLGPYSADVFRVEAEAG